LTIGWHQKVSPKVQNIPDKQKLVTAEFTTMRKHAATGNTDPRCRVAPHPSLSVCCARCACLASYTTLLYIYTTMSEVEDDVYEVNMHLSMKCTIYTPGKASWGGQPGKEKTSTRTKEANLQVLSDDHGGFLNAVSDAVIKEPLVKLKDPSKPWPFKCYGSCIKYGLEVLSMLTY
jgi:hypothetical protein